MESGKELEIKVDMGKYKYIDMELEDAKRLLEIIIEEKGSTRDLEESYRMLTNFNEFYKYQTKRSQSYLSPPKNMGDMIKGNIYIDKLKLIRKEGKDRVVIVFDRRVSIEYIYHLVEKLGYKPSIGNK